MDRPAPMLPPRYRLFIDESGDHAYSRVHEIAHRYLALLGVWFQQPEAEGAFTASLDAIKADFFGTPPRQPVVFHRSDIVNRKGPFGILVDADTRRRFDAKLLDMITRAEFTMVCVIIDKHSHNEKYARPFHPYHYCLTALIERYARWLNEHRSLGDALAESRGGHEDLQLADAYRRVYESGTRFVKREHVQRALTSKDLKLQPKRANIAGLQLADLLAHPIKQHSLLQRGLITDPGPTFGRQIAAAALPKFRMVGSRVDGCGCVWLSQPANP